jgi:hypothetical protein
MLKTTWNFSSRRRAKAIRQTTGLNVTGLGTVGIVGGVAEVLVGRVSAVLDPVAQLCLWQAGAITTREHGHGIVLAATAFALVEVGPGSLGKNNSNT